MTDVTGTDQVQALTGHQCSVAPARAHMADIPAGLQRLGAEHLAPAPQAWLLSKATESKAEPGPRLLLHHA